MSRIAHRSGTVCRRVVETLSVLTMMAMMLHIVGNAVVRTVFNSPIAGTNEYTAYWYLPVIAFLGMYLAAVAGTHIEARLLFDRFPRAVRIEAQVAGQLLTAALFVAFAWYGWGEALEAAKLRLTAGSSTVPMWPVTFIVPVACLAVAVQFLIGAGRVVKNRDPEAARPQVVDNGAVTHTISEVKH